jgi:hypothetical protein
MSRKEGDEQEVARMGGNEIRLLGYLACDLCPKLLAVRQQSILVVERLLSSS